MNIGTATPLRPSGYTGQKPHGIFVPDVVEGIDHYLFNIASPDKPLTLPQWQTAAMNVLRHLTSQGIQPIIVGGTMLYIDSIIRHYAIPDVPPNPALGGAVSAWPSLYARVLTKHT
jgi:hypothetical protein